MIKIFHNAAVLRSRAYPEKLKNTLSKEGAHRALGEIRKWPRYQAMPLIELPDLSRKSGLGQIYFKDESGRFGLKSFKTLGGAYAVSEILKAEIVSQTDNAQVTSADLVAGTYAHITRNITVSCATDGNHGRSVAWGAQMFNCACKIYVHGGVSERRREAITAYGAEVICVEGNYDDTVHHAASEAVKNNWVTVSDTSYEGYSKIPRMVMEGYMVMAAEITEQIAASQIPTHVFIQAGVGGMAAAVCAYFWEVWEEKRPRFIIVEPDKADCLYQSAVAGKPTIVKGDLDTAMAGLACGEISIQAWEILNRGVDDFLVIPDQYAFDAMKILARGKGGDSSLVSGESGAAGLGGLLAICNDDHMRIKLGLGETSSVLLIGTEGDTDEALYQQIVYGR